VFAIEPKYSLESASGRLAMNDFRRPQLSHDVLEDEIANADGRTKFLLDELRYRRAMPCVGVQRPDGRKVDVRILSLGFDCPCGRQIRLDRPLDNPAEIRCEGCGCSHWIQFD
jgi:hypothetical protein